MLLMLIANPDAMAATINIDTRKTIVKCDPLACITNS